MEATTMSNGPHIVRKGRVLPQQPASRELALPLSLLDATTANFGLTSAIWLLEGPPGSLKAFDLTDHLRISLSITLTEYPQWCGFLKSILTTEDHDLAPETRPFPAHAKRYGRVYVHFGTGEDPGAEFIEAKSTATVDSIYSVDPERRRRIWNRRLGEVTLTQFVPPTTVVNALESNTKDTGGLCKPIMAVQCTQLACGGLVLAAKIAHPLADITALTHFVKDWASVSRASLMGDPVPTLSPIFEPTRLDQCAAGDINADEADSSILEDALGLPLHRYDWWAPPASPPPAFPPDLPLAGKQLPWAEWNTSAPVDQYTVHFSSEQIDHLWRVAIQDDPEPSSLQRISKHDALLAHIWSSVVRARGLGADEGPVHCDLVLGTRPVFQLDTSSLGSPTMMLNIEMTASHAALGTALGQIARCIRTTISTVNDPQRLAAHLHSIAYEKSPQRIWQAFLGKRHILVTTWARAGLYEVDFGLGSRIRYADGVVPCMDGCILITDGPPTDSRLSSSTGAGGWTNNGAEITLPLRCEDMRRLLEDPFFFPQL